MKFDKIEVGDTVLINEDVRYSNNNKKEFLIPYKVESKTPALLIVSGGFEVRRKDGSVTNGRYGQTAYYDGEKISRSISFEKNKIAKDETAERVEFKLKLRKEKDINKMLSELRLSANSRFSVSELENIAERIEHLDAELKN